MLLKLNPTMIAMLGIALIVGLSDSAWANQFTSSNLDDAASWPGSAVDAGIFGQGFSPMVRVSPDPGLSPTDLVGLDHFTFFKDGYTDAASNVKLAIFDNFYLDLVGLSTSRPEFMGISTNTLSSTAGLSVGDAYTFDFNGLQLEYGSDYGAVFVNDDGAGNLTPVKVSALTENYFESSPGVFDPVSNYGGIFDFQYSVSNFINSDLFGDFFAGFSNGGDAKFEAAFDVDDPRDLDFEFRTENIDDANTWPGSALDPGIYGQGFSPSLNPTQEGHLSFDKVGLDEFTFYKDGYTDGQTDIKLVIVDDFYMNLDGLTTTSTGVVGVSTNTIASTASLATGDAYTFDFDGLELDYVGEYGAIFVSDDGLGNLTPIKVSALTEDFQEVSPGVFEPTSNYGDNDDAQFSTSSLINSDEFGSFLTAFGEFSADAKFSAAFDLAVVALSGDFNGDGTVDAADYTVWRDNLGGDESTLNGNGVVDGVVDINDYNAWVSNFGASSSSSTAEAVPEPSATMMILAGLIVTGLNTRVNR